MKHYLLLTTILLSFIVVGKAQETQKWGDFRTTPQGPLNKWSSVCGKKLSNGNIIWGLCNVNNAATVKKMYINDYDTDYRFHNGMLAVKNRETGKWGFYNDKGDLLPGGFKWKSYSDFKKPEFSQGVVIVGCNNEWFVLNKEGVAKKIAASDIVDGYPSNNRGITAVMVNGLWGSWKLFNKEGKQVFANISVAADGYLGAHNIEGRPIGDFCDGWARIHLRSGGYTYINESGNKMGEVYTQADHFSEGLAAVAVKTDLGVRWGFINTSGEWAVKPKFSNKPCRFSNGYSVVKKTNGNMCFVNRQGEQVGEEAKCYTNFVDGYAFAASGIKVWMIDKNLNKLTLPTGATTINADDVDRLSKNLPVRTVFGGRYIVSIGEYSGYNESTLFDAKSGIAYYMNFAGSKFNFGCISDNRCHITKDVSFDGKTNQEGFLDDEGNFYLVFAKEEF